MGLFDFLINPGAGRSAQPAPLHQGEKPKAAYHAPAKPRSFPRFSEMGSDEYNDDAVQWLPIKGFFVSEPLAQAAMIDACNDRDRDPKGYINPLDGPLFIGRIKAGTDFKIGYTGTDLVHRANQAIANRKETLMARFGSLEGHDITVIDVVTFPFHYMLCEQVSMPADEAGFGDLIWKANHNVLWPFLEQIYAIGPLCTIPHVREHPIEDAPVHNLLAMHTATKGLSPGERSKRLTELFQALPYAKIVSPASPQMDSRYAPRARRERDGEEGAMRPIGPAKLFDQ